LLPVSGFRVGTVPEQPPCTALPS